jgi:hypothetical protein
MYSATDAASAAIAYTKGNVEDGVVDNLPIRTAGKNPIYSPSPLWGYQSTPYYQELRSPICKSKRTPQRQLYCKDSVLSTMDGDEKDPMRYTTDACVDPAIVLGPSQEHAALAH